MENYLEWIIPIFSSLVTIIATVVTCRWQLRTELRKISENYVSDKKYKAYYNAVDLFYTIMSEMKTNEANGQGNNKVTEMIKVKEDLFVYGSDEAFRAFTNYLCACSDEERKKVSFRAFLEFMLIVRKEISGGESTITQDDILLNIIQSREEFQKYQQFAK